MTNDIVYQQRGTADMSIITARCIMPLYGRWSNLNITTYCDADRNMVAVTFGFAPLDRDIEPNPDRLFDARRDGLLQVRRNGGGNEFEQVIDIRPCSGRILDWSETTGEPVHFARELARVVLKKLSSLIETQRLFIRKGIGKAVSDQVLDMIESRYGAVTDRCIETMLAEINWGLMLHRSGCDERFLTVVTAAMTVHSPDRFAIGFDGATGIELLRPDEVDRFRNRDAASAKATSMLKHVCGEELGQEFADHNHITIHERGYTFVLAPGRFLKCTDPDGKKAELCIHTKGFGCNAIDECVIAFLHIRNRFDEFMDLAVVHSPDFGFSKTKEEHVRA